MEDHRITCKCYRLLLNHPDYFSLLCIDIFICSDDLIQHCTVNPECDIMELKLLLYKTFQTLAEVQYCIDYGSYGNHLFIKVKEGLSSNGGMHHLDMLSNHTCQWNVLHPSCKLEVKNYSFYILFSIDFVYHEQFKIICLLAF